MNGEITLTYNKKEYDFIEFDKNLSKADKVDIGLATISGILTASIELLLGRLFKDKAHVNWNKEDIVKLLKNTYDKKDEPSNFKRFKLKNNLKIIDNDLIMMLVEEFKNNQSLPVSNRTFNAVISWVLNVVINNKIVDERITNYFLNGTNIEKVKATITNFKNDKLDFIDEISHKINERINHRNSDNTDLLNLEEAFKKIQTFPVILNEAIIRVCYAVKELILLINDNKLTCINDLYSINWENIFPNSNRKIDRMMTVSTSIFAGLTTAEAFIKAKGSSNIYTYFTKVAFTLNYPGICKMGLSLYRDKNYLLEDIKESYNVFIQRYKIQEPKKLINIQSMLLSEEDERVLYSIIVNKVKKDIENTKKQIDKEYKQLWLSQFIKDILNNTDEYQTYFFEDKHINQIINDKKRNISLNLALFEGILFIPYFPLGELPENKKIKFDPKCNNVNIDEYNKILKTYKNNFEQIDGSYKIEKNIKNISMIFVPTPEAILTNIFTYRMVKGIDTKLGGGQVFGVLGNGVAPFTQKGVILNECCKLLTFCELFVDDEELIYSIMDRLIEKYKEANNSLLLIEVDNTIEKKEYKFFKQSVKYLSNTINYFDKIINDKTNK